jgi:hypothetical protein
MADEIRKLAAQYFQLVDLQHLALPPGDVLVRPDVQAAIYERMFNETRVFPIPPANYRSRVLKLILSQIEESITDPEEDVCTPLSIHFLFSFMLLYLPLTSCTITFSLQCKKKKKTLCYIEVHFSNKLQEINDDLMECWTELVAQPKQSAVEQAQQISFIKYTAPETEAGSNDQSQCRPANTERSVITSESRGLILSAGTTGFRTWEAALHLGSFLSSKAGEAIVRNKRVIELGAGTGFLSLVCARYLGVHSVVVTDREPALIDNMRECIPHNRNAGKFIPIYPAVWEWGTPLERKGDLAELDSGDDESKGIKFDVALGADLVGRSSLLFDQVVYTNV